MAKAQCTDKGEKPKDSTFLTTLGNDFYLFERTTTDRKDKTYIYGTKIERKKRVLISLLKMLFLVFFASNNGCL